MRRLGVLCATCALLFTVLTAAAQLEQVASASAASSCSVSGTTANVVLDQSGPGTPTDIAQDSSHDLTVGGVACGVLTGAGGLTAVSLTVTSGAASQVVVLDQTGAGGVFPCSALIQGTLRAQDRLEVAGGSGENLSLGDTSSGTGVNLNSCSSVGTLTGLGSYELEGSGFATLVASGGPGFTSSLSVPVTFLVGGSSEVLSAGSTGDTVDFSNVATSPSAKLVVNASGSAVNSQADGTAVVGPTTYTFTSGRSNFTSFVGSSSGSTQFEAGATPGYSFIGQGSSNTLDYSSDPSGVAVDLSAGTTGTVCVVATPCPSGKSDAISGLTTITGSSSGGNTFDGGSSIYSFIGPGNGNTFAVGSGSVSVTDPGLGNKVDFSHLSTSLSLNVTGSSVGLTANDTATSGSATYTFGTSPTTFVGSGGTTSFLAGPTADTFQGVPSAATTLSFAFTSGSSLDVCVVVATGCTTAGTAVLGSTTEPFSGIDTFLGLSAGNTSFDAGAAGGLAFDGAGTGNVLDLSGDTQSSTVNLTTGDALVATGQHDTFSGIRSVIGSSVGSNDFIAGAGNESFADHGSAGGDTVDFSNVATSPSAKLVVNASGSAVNSQADGTAVVGPTTYTFTSGRSNFTSFVGSSSGSTQFEAGATPGYSFIGQGSSNTLDYSSDPSGVAVDLSAGTTGTVCVVATPCPSGKSDAISGLTTITGSSSGGNTFDGGSSIYSFIGPGNGNTFAVGSGSVSVTDPGLGNKVDFSHLSTSLSLNVTGSSVGLTANDTATSGSATYTFGTSPTTFVGSGGTTSFLAGPTADTFQGVPSAATTLSFAFTSGSSLDVCVVVATGCTTAGTAVLGSTTEPFSGIDTFLGLSAGNTSFDAGAAGGLAFDGAGTGNVLDLSGDTQSSTVNLTTGDALVATGQHDTFSGIRSVIGSSVGSNDFIAGAGNESFADHGSAGGDTVDFSNVATSPSAKLVVNASGSAVNSQADGTAVVGPTTYTFTSGRSNFTSFVGSSSGSTQFEAGATPGYSFIGQGSSNTLDYSSDPSGVAVDLSAGTTGTVCVVATPCPSGKSDAISGLTTITGSSSGGNTFDGGSSIYSFIGPGNGNTFAVGSGSVSVTDPGLGNKVDFSHLSTSLSLNVTGSSVGLTANDTATSGSATYTFGTSPTTFVGSGGTTSFLAGPTADTFQGVPSAATTLSFAFTSGSSLDVCVVVATGCTTAGTAVLGSTTEPFSGIDTFLGLSAGNTSFDAGAAGGLAFDGAGTGNVLDLSGAPAGAIAKVNGDTVASPGAVTGLSAASHDSFFGIQRLIGMMTIQSAVTAFPSPLPSGRIKKGYSVQLAGTGGAGGYVDWRIQEGALPAGLTFSSSGLLAGTPTVSGKFTFEVGLESAGIPGGASYVLTIAPPAPSVKSISPTHGSKRGGTVVTIRGANLTGAKTVLFGTKHGTHIVVVSPSELKVTSPKGTGTVNVQVVTAGGTSPRVSKDKFRYT